MTAAVLLLTTSPETALAIPTDTSVDQAERAREELRRKQADLAAQLDLAGASNDQVIAALTTLNQQVQAEMTRVVEAQRAIDDVDRRVAQVHAEIADNQRKIDGHNNDLRQQAVRRYVTPERNDSSMSLLTATNFDEAEQRKVLASVANGDSRETIDQLRTTKARNDELRGQVEAIRGEAELARTTQAPKLAQLQADGDALKRAKAEWDKRLANFEDAHNQLAQLADTDFAQAIAAQRASVPSLTPRFAPGAGSSGGGMIWPLIGTVSRGWLSYHKGIDVWSSANAPTYAAQGGTVKLAGDSRDGYGNKVVIEHGNGLSTLYAHHSRILVSPGQAVSTGQQIGVQGNTGNSRGAHLHFEVHVNGRAVNPAPYLPGR